MSDVIELDDHRLHKNGVVVCLNCWHKWVGVAPTDVSRFECPNCGGMDGEMFEDADK